MPCLLNSPDSSNRSFHFRQPGYVPHVGTGEKRLWGGRPRHEPCHPTTFFRLSRLHTPLPRCLSFHSLMQLSGSYKKRCPRADGTRANSRLTEINPYSAPVIRGHMCLACQKSRFSSCSPFASGEQSEKTITDTPWLFAVFVAPVVLAPRLTDTPWLHDQPQDKMRRYAMNISACANNAYRRV